MIPPTFEEVESFSNRSKFDVVSIGTPTMYSVLKVVHRLSDDTYWEVYLEHDCDPNERSITQVFPKPYSGVHYVRKEEL